MAQKQKKGLQGIICQRSRDNMGKALNLLRIQLKRLPEWDTAKREVLSRKIEMLKIIRVEMKELINNLE